MGCGSSDLNNLDGYDNRPRSIQKDNTFGRNGSMVSNAGSMGTRRAANAMERQLERYGYPAPFPPSSRKEQIFNKDACANLDKYASKLPTPVLYGNFEEVGKYLTKTCKNDIEKVRALFTWTTSIDISSLQSSLEKLPDPGTPLDYLLRIHWQMGNHAHFFAQLCRSAGLPCIIVTGVNKSAAYQLGSKVERSSMAAQWNAVFCDGEWRLIDVFWASTCVIGQRSNEWALVDVDGETVEGEEEDNEGETKHQVNESFFLTDPDQMICTHLPDDPAWQLLPQGITQEQFETFAYIRERFFQLNMNMLPDSKKECLLQTQGGEVDLTFSIPKEAGKDIQFRYLLFKNRQKGDNIPIPLDRFVFYQKTNDAIKYNARFPVAGRFKFDIFGQNEKVDETFDLCASYLVDCNDPQKNLEPLPDCPDIGWGPGVEAEEAGLKPTSHEDAVIETDNGIVEIRFKLDNPMTLMQNLKNNDLDELLLKRNAMLRVDNDELVVTVRLPKKGDYALNLYGDKKEVEGELPNVCNYLIKCMKDNEQQAFPKLHEGMVGKSNVAGKLGVTPKSHKSDTIKTDTGKLEIEFEANDDIELFCEIQNNEIDNEALGQCVSTNNNGKSRKFDLNLPKAGEYAMNVYARKKGDDSQVYHVHTYYIESSQKESESLPPPSEEIPIIPIYVTGEMAEIRVPAGEKPRLAELFRKNAQQQIDPNNIKVKRVGDEDVYRVKLPEYGEYKMDLFDQRENGTLAAVAQYQIIRHEPLPGQEEEAVEEEPEEELSEEEKKKLAEEKALEAKYKKYRDNLRAAIASQDPDLLRMAIRDYEVHKVPEKNGDLTKAKKLLDFLQISQDLTESMSSRNLQKLEKAIDRAEKAGFDKKLGLQMQMAYRIRDQLRRIEKLRHDILNLDSKTIAEIKSYSKPPEAVHFVMSATFLLLGESDKSLRDWKSVVVLIGKTGKESLKRRVTEFKVEKLNIEVAMKAKQVLTKFSLDEVRDVSAGAGTFYVWSQGMIDEAESRFTQSGGDLKSVQPTGKTGKGKNKRVSIAPK